MRATPALALALFLAGGAANAQPRGPRSPIGAAPAGSHAKSEASAPSSLSAPASLRARFGVDAASRLMRSPDADERLRGIERAAATETPEGLALLERAARASGPAALDPRLPDEGLARKDPRALLAVVRSLASWTADDVARGVLEEIVRAPSGAFATRPASLAAPSHEGRDDHDARPVGDPTVDEAMGADRITLAREEAAIALAESGSPVALERLVTASRSGGPGQDAALLALSIAPPSDPVTLGGVALTTPATIALASRIGDLRSLDAILGAVHASDPALRAAAIVALGAGGDTRVLEVARASLHDPDPRVRVAAVEALASLGTADAATGTEALVGDDATVMDGLRLAQSVQGEGVTKAAAARALATADPLMRAAALAALGRQASPLAVHALAVLVAMPALQGDAACALARSPGGEALAAIDALASAPATRRIGARAYFVRRFVRGERSARLDGVLHALAVSADGADRAVGTQALVALGERTLDAGLSDADARVRRAAAMGAMARPAAWRRSAIARPEPDEATREVLALAWTDADDGAANVPTSFLLDRATSGEADAPLAAFALARRSDEGLRDPVDALLRSPDALLRAETARGLGASPAPDARGRLAAAYAWEPDASVRRALLAALASDGGGSGDRGELDPASRVFDLAARLDPDPMARWIAASALAGSPAGPSAPDGGRAIAWLRVVPPEDAAAPLGVTGSIATGDGRVLPIVFDDDGYALVVGVSPGDARLRLAPRLPAYSPPTP